MARLRQVTIVGLGLIGGSLGLAIRRQRLAGRVVGFSRKRRTLARAKRLGAIDRGSTSLKEAVREADVVILATPVDTMVPLAKRLVRWMPQGSVLTDVGSTKVRLVQALERVVPSQVAFIGAHPLAGSERRGIQASRRQLFDGAICVVTVTARTRPHARRVVTRLWKAVVDRVVVMSPRTHDRLLAAVSHVPHLVASCLMRSTDPKALRLAPKSFSDVTRVAASDPDLWDDIYLSNRQDVLVAMDRFERTWRGARRSLVTRNRQALRAGLRDAKTRRQALQDR